MEQVGKRITGRTRSYVDQRVVVRDAKDNRQLLDVKIMEHNETYNTIDVPVPGPDVFVGVQRVELFIITPRQVFSYHGTLRNSVRSHAITIALYGGVIKNDRKHARYNVDVPAEAISLIIGEKQIDLRVPIPARAVDISGGGIQLVASSNAFMPKSEFVLSLIIADQPALLHCSVVRITPIDSKTSNFGCSFKTKE